MSDDASLEYHVLINREDQYAIWPDGRNPPLGWRALAGPMSRQAALGFIDAVWSDDRPLGLRQQLEALEGSGGGD